MAEKLYECMCVFWGEGGGWFELKVLFSTTVIDC